MLAQQASGYDVGGHNFHIQEQPMYKNFNFFRAGADQSAKLTHLVGSADFPSAEAKRLGRLLQSARSTPPSQLS
jgi:hypothetical protein